MHTKTHRLVGTAAVGVLLLMASACGSSNNSSGSSAEGQAVRGGTLNMLGAGDVDYMDPNISYYSIGYLNLRMWSRQLFTYPADPNQSTTATPDLATQIPTVANGGITDNGKTYTITMRQGVKWNTTPERDVTAQDVVRGVMRTCNPVQPFGGTPDFADLIVGYQSFCNGFEKVGQSVDAIRNYIDSNTIPGVTATNDHTVVFKLTHPATYFVDMLTMPAFSPAPKEVLNYLPASTALGQHQISDGPYQVQTWDPTKQIVYTRNPAWNPATDPIHKAYVDKIVVDETVSQDSTQLQLQTGTDTADMEWDNFPPPSQLPGLMNTNDPNLNLGDTFSTNPYIVFNMASPNNGSALNDIRVREALEYALNRDHIIQVLGGPTLNPPLTHVLPTGITGSQPADPYPYNPTKAKQLLAAAGHPNGMTVKFLYRNSSEGSRKTFATLQQDLGKVGINVTGVAVPNADFYTKYLEVPNAAKRGTWDLALAGWGPDWYGNAALTFFKPLFSGEPSFPPLGSNFGLYSDQTTNNLISQAVAAPSESEAAGLWAKADAQVMKDAVFFPITEPKQPNYHASQVNNAVYIPAIQNFDPTNVWLNSDAQGG